MQRLEGELKITADEIRAANRRIKSRPELVLTTPLEPSPALSALTGCRILLKNEHLQRTGSFKLRGAANRLSLLSAEEKRLGVIAASSGNHGLAVAYCAALMGINAAIYVPEDASSAKTRAIERYGAHLQRVSGDGLAAELEARRAAVESGRVYISPYNDAAVVCGQGTVGLELAESAGELDAVFVAVGGGGLIAGIGTFLRAVSPQTEIVGCWPENAPALYESMNRGAVVDVEERPTLSDGTAGGLERGAITLPICLQVIDRKVTVSETEIAEAMRLIAEHEHFILEGSAAVPVAAALNEAHRCQARAVALVLCGRNIALDKFLSVI